MTRKMLLLLSDRDLLLAVKQGKYTLEKLKDLAQKEFAKVEEAYKHSDLPEDNDVASINKLLIKIIKLENT